MKTLIITGGMIEADFALSFIQELKPDYILGVDKGLQFCYEYDIRPDYIVGDFDSLPGEILVPVAPRIQISVLPSSRALSSAIFVSVASFTGL